MHDPRRRASEGMTESFAELFEQSLANQRIRPGMILTGLIVDVTADVVIVNVGLKSEAVIPLEQFKNERGEVEVKAGDEVEVALDSVEDGTGETRLSREKAKRARTWTRLEDGIQQVRDRHRRHHRPRQGRLHGRDRQRPRVPAGLARRRAPGARHRPTSRTSRSSSRSSSSTRSAITSSSRAARSSSRNSPPSAARSWTTCRKARSCSGTVKNLTDYGAFVDLGGIDGLLHITDMAWKRVKHPSEVVKVGDEIDVRILKFDRERSRVSLGLKQLGADPWENIARRYPPHTRVFGKVTNIADYGAFVEIEDGVEGLVHVSEMDWTNKNVNPAKVVHTGQEVEVMVLDVDEERRRISLGLKQCKANPWKEFAENYNRGDKVAGPDQVDHRLRHLHRPAGQHRRPGAPVRHLLGSCRARRRCATTRRASSSKPWCCRSIRSASASRSASSSSPRIRSRPTSPRTPRARSSGASSRKWTRAAPIIDLGNGIEGQLRASELGRDRVEDARTVLKVGEEVEAKFTGVDRKSRTISLSIKAKEMHEEAEAVQSYRSETGAPRAPAWAIC